MFSGIVEESAAVASVRHMTSGATLRVKSSLDLADVLPGHSIAIDGVCLTVTTRNSAEVEFDVGSESLRRTTLGSLKAGSRVNFERSLRITDRIHGHLVSGHVDDTARLAKREIQGQTERLVWSFPASLSPYIAEKGAVALSGVSLTVGKVQGLELEVYIIPHTLALTTLASMRPGEAVNIEVDLLSRYVHAALGGAPRDGAWRELLSKAGFIHE